MGSNKFEKILKIKKNEKWLKILAIIHIAFK